jgi:hypothetical protein
MVARELQLNAVPTLPQKGRANMKKACYLMKSIGEGKISIFFFHYRVIIGE